MVHSSRPLRSALQKIFSRITPVSDYFLGAWTSIPPCLCAQIGWDALRCGARGRCSLRNGTLPLEAAVVSFGRGRKCAFGATTGDCCESILKPRRNSTNPLEARSWTRHATAQLEAAAAPQWSCARCPGVLHWCAAAPAGAAGGVLRLRLQQRRPRGVSESCQI